MISTLSAWQDSGGRHSGDSDHRSLAQENMVLRHCKLVGGRVVDPAGSTNLLLQVLIVHLSLQSLAFVEWLLKPGASEMGRCLNFTLLKIRKVMLLKF